MKEKSSRLSHLANLIFPALVFGGVSGILTAFVVVLYKWCAHHVIDFSQKCYDFLGEHPVVIFAVAAIMFAAAYLYSYVYKNHSYLKGGGIPTSISMLRGIIRFKWIENIVGVFLLSMGSFLFGVPLGNEGPAVQMGTAIGKGSVSVFAKKQRAWSRYAMTGGACAGFSVATGSPISGILFALEEAHQRISPMILTSSAVSVVFAKITTEIISPLFGVSPRLFPSIDIPQLDFRSIWIPVIIGLAVGLFAVLFLKYYNFLSVSINKKAKKIPSYIKIFLVFLLTLIMGMVSFSFVSTGHELILDLFEVKYSIVMLVLLLIVRTTITLFANSCGITGGIFLPILALGALLSSAIATVCTNVFSLSAELYTIMLVLGICACVSSMMKMPLTAIIFSVEALSCHNNILSVIIVAVLSYVVTELFDVKSINDSVIEHRERQVEKQDKKLIDAYVTVMPSSFAVEKQIRDILWPRNLFVLSVKALSKDRVVDEHGGRELQVGDVLHLHYSTTDEEYTKKEILSIVGEQELRETE